MKLMKSPTLEQLPEPTKRKFGWPWTEECPRLPDSMPNGQTWPTISIVTPSFNQAQFLEETIRSVLLQGYPNLEYIIVDGGSTDGSVDIIRKYEKWLTYWVSELDEGQADAINKGWSRAHGEITTWLNSDDTYCPGSLAIVARYFMSNPDVDFVYGGCNCVDENGSSLGVMKAWNFNLKRQMTGRNLIIQPSSFYKKDILNKVGNLNVNLHYAMDYDLWLRIILNDYKICNNPTILSNFRFHRSSKTISGQMDMIMEVKQVLENIYKSNELPHRYLRWSGRAFNIHHCSLGEYFFYINQYNKARKEFFRAIRFKPFRLTNFIVLCYIFDTWFGTNFGSTLQEFRWKLPDVPKGDQLMNRYIYKVSE